MTAISMSASLSSTSQVSWCRIRRVGTGSASFLPAFLQGSLRRRSMPPPKHRNFIALAHPASCDPDAGERVQHLEAMADRHRHLEILAENCPENYAHRAALVGAEIARLESRPLDAMDLCEQAPRSAKANGFVHDEALAYERAAALQRERGFDEFAELYLRNARACYASRGADGKVRQLDQLYPNL